jgi:hypothetical protein
MRQSLLVLVLCISFSSYSQTKPKKIQIALLGTFHFNQSVDSASKLHSNLFSEKRQRELNEVIGGLAKFNPDKIFLEREPSEQPFWDSLYDNFKKGIDPGTKRLLSNEIVQLGFKTAKKTGKSKLICVDFQPENYGQKTFATKDPVEKAIKQLWDQIEQYNDSININPNFYNLPYPNKRLKQDSLLQKSTLREYLLSLNTPENYQYFSYNDWNWFYSLGKKEEYVGTDWLANFWYGRNLRILNNILRQADLKTDNKYLLIYGSSHISFIKFLLENHPYFEVVDLKDVLN